jgi:signal transduction histidine kinase
MSARLRALADYYPDGILGADAKGVVTVINAQACALLGAKDEDVIGRSIDDVLRLRDQDGHTWMEVNRPYSTIGITHGIPEQAWLNSGAEEVLTTARLIREHHLGPVRSLAISLRSGRGRARLDRERSDLVATVAHELRSPLTGVKGFVTALLNRWDRLTDDQRKLMLTTVSADADRLARLIAELLDVARIDTGRLQLYPRPSSAEVLTRRVVDSVAAGTTREIDLAAEPDLPDVFADPDKFTQVVTNLIENAIRHGAGMVRVTITRLDDEPFVRIIVDDEGEGIAPEIRRRAFTKFWTSGESGGSGLGMYIVGGLTKAHGGAVTIDQAPGGGARVVVDWPCEDLRESST